MPRFLIFYAVLIAILVSASAKTLKQADNASEVRSLVSEIPSGSSVVNDNICNNHEKNVAFDVILLDNDSHGEGKIINKRHAPRDRNYKDRPRPDQKSLLIVFDATGSMHDDLEQLRAGAQEIITEFSAREDNPIYNYVLVVYRDPTVEPPFDTKNPDELLARLKEIQTVGGGDCPEYALNGLKIALEFALPNSLAYVFSDATAKDYRHDEEVLEMIQRKQVAVNFLLTGDCDDPTSAGYKVYLKLSHASNGQVYDMNKSNVKDVLLAIRHTVNYNYAALKSVDAESAGTTNTRLNIDKSISELSVSLSGKNPKLTITDPRNETVQSSDELSLQNLRLVKIKDPVDGVWNVESVADSSHTIRLGAISDMRFEFGFSVDEPRKQSETSFQPLGGQNNVLSIFVSDPTLIKNLSDVTISLVASQPREKPVQFKIPLKKLEDNTYVTKSFEVPRQMFKIQLNGIDANGNIIERLISTGLQSSAGSAPDVVIQVSQKEINEYDNLLLKCVVKSHTQVDITWTNRRKTLKQIVSNQSNDLDFVIDRVSKLDSGKYICSASNAFGSEQKEVSIKVMSAPRVLMLPSKLNTVEGVDNVLECIVESHDDEVHEITWIDIDGNLVRDTKSGAFEFVATRAHHNKTITCQVNHADVMIFNSSFITVEYPPKFVFPLTTDAVKVQHGSNFVLDCETEENPKGKVDWTFTPERTGIKQAILNDENIFTISSMSGSKQGIYECTVKNSLGRIKRSFNVKDQPKAAPKILMDKDVIIVNETESIDLSCDTLNSLPITNSSWYNENSNNYEQFVHMDETTDEYRNVLRISDIDELDNGSFECLIANALGEDKITFELLVQTAPKIDSIVKKSGDQDVEIEESLWHLEDQELILECVVDGFPMPDIKWFHDSEELAFVRGKTSLNFKRIRQSDSGNYKCFAENILGTTSKGFRLDVNVAPASLTLAESFVKVLENEKLFLDCDVRAEPPPAISWFINGNPTADDSRVKFEEDHKVLTLETRLSDSGEYSCWAENEFGRASVNFTVLVLGMPRILLPTDERKKAVVGKNLELVCDATGFPIPIITWFRSEKVVSSGSALSLSNLNIQDSGAYICSASNEVGTSEKVFYLEVVQHPKILSVFGELTLFTNQTETLQCLAEGSPAPDVYWTFDGVKISQRSEMAFVSSMSSGRYFCVAENSEGSDKKSIDFKAINKPSLTPNHEELKKEIKLREGEGLELLCPFENFNLVSWTLNNKSIENIPHDKSENKLTLHKVDGSINGDWKCEVSNSAGNDTFPFKVSILASPVIHASWNLNSRMSDFLVTESDIDEKSFKVGETLTLNCEAQGFPKPKVIWKKASDQIGEGETLIIENLEFHHSDIYTCNAENEQGSVKKFFKIDVVAPPHIDNLDIQRSFQKAIGDSIILKCNTIGNPIPNIFWFKDNVLIEDEAEAYLELKNLTPANHGTFKCIAKNSWGKETIEYHVSVMESATVVEAREAPKANRNDNSLRLSCTVRGNPMPVISWIKNGHILSTSSKLNLAKLFTSVEYPVYFNGFGNSISYLDPFEVKRSNEKFYSQLTKLDDKSMKLEIVFRDRDLKKSGTYNCYGYNALGRDEQAVEVKIYEKPAVNEKQMTQLRDIEVLERLPLLLSCLITGEPSPKIIWFKENVQLHDNETINFLNENRFLSISETFKWNSGNYTCRGVNEMGEKEIVFKVSVLAPPKFVEYSVALPKTGSNFHNDKLKVAQKNEIKDTVKIMRGDDVTLECFAEGSPSPKVHWLKLNLFDPSKNELLDEDENIMVLRAVKDSASFMCYLNNTVGHINRIFNVESQFPPHFVEDTKLEHHHLVKLHHGVNNICKLEGNPEPKIRWLFNGTEISDNEKEFYFSHDKQVMRIVDTKKSNQGKFLCEGENEFGKVVRVFYIKVDVPIQWSAFGPWTTCSVSCGTGGLQYRSRICLLSNGYPATVDDYKCVGENVETRKCNRLPCPLNGGWSKFSKWSDCPVCFNETDELPVVSKRTRKCDSPLPTNGGLECSGEESEEIECNVHPCPINGGWSNWSVWSPCTKTCGLTHRMRKRFCNTPAPKYNGSDCTGENVEYEECKLKPCPLQNINRRSFNVKDEDELEELSNETRDKYGGTAEFELKKQAGVTRNWQQMKHKAIEVVAPPRENDEPKVPKLTITLDTYKPISEETYNQHMKQVENIVSDGSVENTSLESIELDRPQPRTCIRGFFYNSLFAQCEDINECNDRRHHNCASNERCVNTIGSFRCERATRRS